LRRLRRFHCLGPVALPPLGSAGCATISTPLRDFCFPRDQSVQPLCCLPVRLTNPPDFLSLPAARPDQSLGCGSSFQVRYVSAGLLFLKPLGTILTMLPMRIFVNAFPVWNGTFSSIFIPFVFNNLGNFSGESVVDKTRARHLDFAIL
jgi:hypothetical protein